MRTVVAPLPYRERLHKRISKNHCSKEPVSRLDESNPTSMAGSTEIAGLLLSFRPPDALHRLMKG